LGDRRASRLQKADCWFVRGNDLTSDRSFTHLRAAAVTTISIILSSNKVKSGYILVPANPGSAGKMIVKMGREGGRERECVFQFKQDTKGYNPLVAK